MYHSENDPETFDHSPPEYVEDSREHDVMRAREFPKYGETVPVPVGVEPEEPYLT